MKTKVLFMLLCVLLVISPMVANENIYFPEGTKWVDRTIERNPMTGEIIKSYGGIYTIEEDTLIEGKVYHKLIDAKGQLFATLREDGKKIYFRYNDTDMLLYDFGVEVGDTIEFGGLLGYAPIMPVNKYSSVNFVKRGGRIPAPIHSLKN